MTILLIQNKSNYYLNQLKFYKLKKKQTNNTRFGKKVLNKEIFRQKLDYIHNNPVKRGYADDLAHWRYFSYRNYIKQPGLLQVDLIDL